MGAKFTLVLDTDDSAGLRDALEIALLLNRNHNTGYESSIPKAKIGKIAMIKLVRTVAKRVEEGKQDASLRDSKRFVDERWTELVHKS
jgi:hypothetical protein|tara:strand:- start:3948 stop:4211 length:264 start_codon:yes stop_codon:yes gene_type:complete